MVFFEFARKFVDRLCLRFIFGEITDSLFVEQREQDILEEVSKILQGHDVVRIARHQVHSPLQPQVFFKALLAVLATVFVRLVLAVVILRMLAILLFLVRFIVTAAEAASGLAPVRILVVGQKWFLVGITTLGKDVHP